MVVCLRPRDSSSRGVPIFLPRLACPSPARWSGGLEPVGTGPTPHWSWRLIRSPSHSREAGAASWSLGSRSTEEVLPWTLVQVNQTTGNAAIPWAWNIFLLYTPLLLPLFPSRSCLAPLSGEAGMEALSVPCSGGEHKQNDPWSAWYTE